MTFNIALENERDLVADSFGTVTVAESALNELTFTIDVDESLLGPDADIHKFGFQLNGYSGAIPDLSPESVVVGGKEAEFSIEADEKVPGLGGRSRFDYVVSFDNGTPFLDPLRFTLRSESPLSLANLAPRDTITTNQGHDVNFGMHIQTTATRAGSEALLGIWESYSPRDEPVPEPGAYAVWGALSFCGLVVRRRQRKSHG